VCAALLLLCWPIRGYAQTVEGTNAVRPAGATTSSKASAFDSYGKLPLSFEANGGQVNNSVKFLSRGQGYTLFLTGDEAVLRLTKSQGEASASRSPKSGLKSNAASAEATDAIVRMTLVGANTSAVVTGGEELPSKSNYFLGNDPAKWQSNVPNYAQVKYRSIYPGVDLVYYGNQSGHLEYDFVVAPGADPGVIALNVTAGGGAKPPPASRRQR
jgi:hypothetical protein